ncbi:MAG: endonuclease III [Acidobacteria bacterium]|nr:endonuclease III [Acidobacteriota bacterium]MCZ6878072.1 endonuclease III [Acidobacteriota bacterium]
MCPQKSATKREVKEEHRVAEILRRLDREYPDAQCALHFENPYQLLVATILSAQCTDTRVNMVTPQLFTRYPTPEDLAQADEKKLQELIRSTGFFRNKAKNLVGAAQGIVAEFEGKVPESMEKMVELPGVARKTANVVLGTGFGITSGIVVDTHVKRLSHRLGMTTHKDPNKIEQDLMGQIPEHHWIGFSHQLIHHGRRICKSRRPRCEACVLANLCPYCQSECP